MQRMGRHSVGRELTATGLLSSYEADHEGTPVLLRAFMAGIRPDAAEVTRFEEQAAIAAGLDHPGIGRPVAWSADDPVHVSVPALRGATLAEVCAASTTTRLDPMVAAALGAELAAALAAAHASGLVHGGLSPETIVIGPDGKAKVIDFALARLITSLSAASSRVMRGAIECLAPEHFDAPDDLGPATDVFGLGVVMYRAMTGQEPFEAASALATSILLSIGKVTPIDAHGISIPGPLATLVMSMLAREPSERPTMRDVSAALTSMGASADGPYLDAMRRLVATSSSWLPRAATLATPAAAPPVAAPPAAAPPVAAPPVAAPPVAPAARHRHRRAPRRRLPRRPSPRPLLRLRRQLPRPAPPLVGSPAPPPVAETFDDSRDRPSGPTRPTSTRATSRACSRISPRRCRARTSTGRGRRRTISRCRRRWSSPIRGPPRRRPPPRRRRSRRARLRRPPCRLARGCRTGCSGPASGSARSWSSASPSRSRCGSRGDSMRVGRGVEPLARLARRSRYRPVRQKRSS
ncbi:MAG: protein kinase [Sandaracinaceae bacterium]